MQVDPAAASTGDKAPGKVEQGKQVKKRGLWGLSPFDQMEMDAREEAARKKAEGGAAAGGGAACAHVFTNREDLAAAIERRRKKSRPAFPPTIPNVPIDTKCFRCRKPCNPKP